MVTRLAPERLAPRRADALLLTTAAILGVARIALVLAENVAVHHWDTKAYLNAARAPLSGLLSDSTRAPAYPLLLKLVGLDERAMIVGQTVVASFAWLFLAHTLAQWCPGRRLRLVALLVFAVPSFAVSIWQWDCILYAESLSFALFALMAAFVLRYARERRTAELVWLAILSVPFCLMRDTNLLTCVVAGIFVGALRTAGSRASATRAAVLAVLLVGSPVLALLSVAMGARGAVPTANVILLRVVTEPRLRDRMLSDYGMPRSALACAGVLTWDCPDPLIEFRGWSAGPGRRAYLRLLATEPGFAIRSVWGAWAEMAGAPGIGFYGDPAAIRRAHADQPKVHTVPLYDGFGSHLGPGRLFARAASRLTFAAWIARVDVRAGRLLALVPLGVLVAVIFTSPTTRAAGMVVPASFFAAVMIAQLPIALFATDATTRLALLASISLSYLALCLVLLVAEHVCLRSGVTMPSTRLPRD